MKLEQFREIASRLCLLDPVQPVLVGVSGGPDSLCLVDALAHSGFQPVIAHFDHRLRAESGRDAQFVQAYAREMKLPFVLGSADVAAFAAQERLSLEEAARILRYRFLFAQAQPMGAQAVAVGHTADDQVETVLMHFLRGAGLGGLKGMTYRDILPDWSATLPVVRPLLPFWRGETVSYCRDRGLSPVEDASNQDTTFLRNRIRHEALPMLEQLNPQLRQNIWRTAQILAGDAQVVDAAVATVMSDAVCQDAEMEQLATHSAVALRAAVVKAQPLGLQRALLRKAIEWIDSSLRDVDFAAVERALAFLQSGADGQVDLVRGLRVVLEGERLWVATDAALPPDPHWLQLQQPQAALREPEALTLALGAGWKLRFDWQDRTVHDANFQRDGAAWRAWLDADQLAAGALLVRGMRPGDRFQPLGMDGRSMKLSDFWVNQKLPRRARAQWPLLTSGAAIAWIPGFRPAHPFRVTAETRRVLFCQVVQPDGTLV